MFRSTIHRIERIGLTVASIDHAGAFFTEALGFQIVSRAQRGGAGFAALTGVAEARVEVAVLRLGAQEIELLAFDPPGRPYPRPAAANDPWFQHFAIVVGDMDAAYDRAMAHGAKSISTGGPVTLPPATGGIRAWKFRDTLGHPLELSWFPAGVAPAAWRASPPDQVFLGVDHSAIAAADIEASVGFYTALGMMVTARQVNIGPTQDRLDGLPEAKVDIVSLGTPDEGPHMELLGYRRPRSAVAAIAMAANDVAATRLIFQVEDVDGLAERLPRIGGALVSDRVVTLDGGGRAALMRDPDGHLLELRTQA